MDVAGDDLCHRPHLGALDWVLGQHRRLWMDLVKIRYSMMASDWSSKSPLSRVSAGTGFCGLMPQIPGRAARRLPR
jgi:hypothetical protein